MADADGVRRDRPSGPGTRQDGQPPVDEPRARRTFGSLFAGIGGIDIGLERAGWDCRFQVEWDPYCQHILEHHWPDVQRLGDIADAHGVAYCPVADTASLEGSRSIGEGDRGGRPEAPPRDGGHCPGCIPAVDLLAGGFPCQPFSNAGKRRGVEDERWLWPQFARLIGELRPRYVLVENVPGLLARHGGMGRVLADLSTLGYDAEWDSVPAAAVGAPHLRYRVWIIAYDVADAGRVGVRTERRSGARPGGAGEREGVQRQRRRNAAGAGGPDARPLPGGDVAYADGIGLGRDAALRSPSLAGIREEEAGPEPGGTGQGAVSDADRARLQGRDERPDGAGGARRGVPDAGQARGPMADSDRHRQDPAAEARGRRGDEGAERHAVVSGDVPDALGGGQSGPREPVAPVHPAPRIDWKAALAFDGGASDQWRVEPDVGRVADGVPARMDRLRALGNAVVPQVVEVIGRSILELEEETR